MADWNSIYNELDLLYQRANRRAKVLRAALPPREWAPLHHLALVTDEIQIVTLFFFSGAAATRQGAPPVAPYAHEALRAWADRVEPDHSAYTMARIVAPAHCASMEGALPAIGRRWIDQTVINRIAPAHPGATLTVEQVARWLVPSAKSGGAQWVRRVSEVFDMQIPTALEQSLIDLISFRNAVVHPERWDIVGAGPDEEVRTRVCCWSFAVAVLAELAAESIARSRVPGLLLPA